MLYLMLFFLFSFLILLRSQQPAMVGAACMTAWVLGIVIFSILDIDILLGPNGEERFANAVGDRILDGVWHFLVLGGISIVFVWAKRNYVMAKAARRRARHQRKEQPGRQMSES